MGENFYYNIKNLKEHEFINNEMLYNALCKNYITTEQYIELIDDNEKALDGIKQYYIKLTKENLSLFLAKNPYITEDGKKYSATIEKQSLLANEITTYQLAKSANKDYKLTWNTTGEESVEMNIDELTNLALAISSYVKPFVTLQQERETNIRKASSVDDVLKIEVEYSR